MRWQDGASEGGVVDQCPTPMSSFSNVMRKQKSAYHGHECGVSRAVFENLGGSSLLDSLEISTTSLS